MNKVVIEINKGMVANIFSDLRDVQVIVLDWDLREREQETVAEFAMHQPLTSISEKTEREINQLSRFEGSI